MGDDHFWVRVNLYTDEIEAVADTQRELARLCGVKTESIRQTMSRAKHEGRRCIYLKIMEDEDD